MAGPITIPEREKILKLLQDADRFNEDPVALLPLSRLHDSIATILGKQRRLKAQGVVMAFELARIDFGRSLKGVPGALFITIVKVNIPNYIAALVTDESLRAEVLAGWKESHPGYF